jgi:hypothetical protein
MEIPRPVPKVFLLNPDNMAFLRKQIERPVIPFRPSTAVGLMIALVSILLLASAIFVIPLWGDWLLFRSHVEMTSGEVLGARINGDEAAVSYEYWVNDRAYQGDQVISLADYRRIAGNQIEIRYLRRSPGESRINGVKAVDETSRLIWSIVAVGLLVLLLGLISMILEARSDHRKLMAEGQLLRGEVVNCKVQYREKFNSADVLIGVLFGALGMLVRGLLSGSGKGREKTPVGVELKYRFVSPTSGKTINRTHHTKFPSDRAFTIPAAGVSVAVFYHSDRLYRIL